MATRYRNAFLGFSGFVTSVATAQKAAPAKTVKSSRNATASVQKAVPGDARRSSAHSKAA